MRLLRRNQYIDNGSKCTEEKSIKKRLTWGIVLDWATKKDRDGKLIVCVGLMNRYIYIVF